MKPNLKKQLVYLLVIVLAIGGTGLSCSGGNSSNQQATLTFWKPFDSSDKWQQIIADYQAVNKGVQIQYTQKPAETYEADLIDAMASGQGPDIYSIESHWLPRYKDKLEPLSISKNFLKTPIRDVFADTVTTDLTEGDNLYAIPSSIDVMVMYYNRQHLASAGIARAPATWPELVDMVPKLTKLTGDNRLAQSAAALGTSSNINRAADILQLLMLQSGVEFYDSSKGSITLDDGSSGSSGNGSAAERALQFYTQFSNPTSKAYTWNSKQPYSIDAFTQGKVTFLFGYSYLRPILTAKQSFLDYGVAPMPQASTIANKVNFGSYWADTVWNGSKNKSVAWDFLKFAASYTENQIYVNGTQQPSSRKDVLTEQQKNADMAVFADAVFSARTVVKPHSAQFDQILNDLIDDVSLNGISTQSALSDATTKLNLLLKKYPVSGSN